MYTKKMLKGWEKFLNRTVIETYEDDHIVSYIFSLNGYMPVNCSKYTCTSWNFITTEYAASQLGIYKTYNTNKILDQRVLELYGKPINEIVKNINNYKRLYEL